MYRDLVYSVSIQATLMEEEKLYYVQSCVSFSAVLEQYQKKINYMYVQDTFLHTTSPTNWGFVM